MASFLDLAGLSRFLTKLNDRFVTKDELEENYISKDSLGDLSIDDLKTLKDDVAFLKKHAIQDSGE